MSDFFVGYKKMPTKLKTVYALVTICALALSAVVSYSVAKTQKPSGFGSWDTSEPTIQTGFLTVDPYPILHRPAQSHNGEVESVLLISIGKHSAERAAIDHAGKMVSVTGFAINRGGWHMLELGAEDAIQVLDDQSDVEQLKQHTSRTVLQTVKLTGEIIDSKCFLGVMKPGSGPVHKACAELCLLGGIPPMLVVEDQQKTKFGYLLTLNDGSSASVSVAKLAAESVDVTGTLEQAGDMLYLRLDNTDLKVH